MFDRVAKTIGTSDGAVLVTATLTALAGHEAALRAATVMLRDAVRMNKPGCLLFMANGGSEIPGDVVLWEIFADRSSWEAHKASHHLADWFDGIRGDTATAFDVHVLAPLAA